MSKKIFENLTFERVVGGALLVIALSVMLYCIAYIWVSIDARQNCHETGWLAHKVDLNFTRYCTARIQGSDIIIPFDEAVEHGNMTNLWLREIFKGGQPPATEASN